MNDVVQGYVPRAGEFDPLAEELQPASVAAVVSAAAPPAAKERELFIRWFTPGALAAYEPPPDQTLVGDYHLQRGAVSVLAGPPGCGKSRAALWLALLGVQGVGAWFGLPLKTPFRTLLLQNENGLCRLHRDLEAIGEQFGPAAALDESVKISAPPAYGLALSNPYFRAELKATVKDFAPNLVILDPFNATLRDAQERDFQEALARLREVLAASPTEPGCLILHHLRKPKAEDRHRGRSLANLLSGSYVLVSVARSVLVMQPGSDDTEGTEVVLTCAKNNDGNLGPRTAWARGTVGFERVGEFDFEAFDNGGGSRHEPKVHEEHLRELFEHGQRRMVLKNAAERLEEIADCGRSVAYEALKVIGGRFSDLLARDEDGLIGLRLAAGADEAEADEPL